MREKLSESERKTMFENMEDMITDLKSKIVDLEDDIEDKERDISRLEDEVHEAENNTDSSAYALEEIEHLFKYLPYEKVVTFDDIKEIFRSYFR